MAPGVLGNPPFFEPRVVHSLKPGLGGSQI